MVNKCRFCNTELNQVFVDLGMSPLANSYLSSKELNRMEPFYPLCTFVCKECLLVQLEEFESPKNIFTNYAYFSSYSQTWLKHVEDFANMVINRFSLKKNSQVIEIASNDGYLLQHFQKRNISILGIEPAANVAKVAEDKGIPTRTKFFGTKTAMELVNENKKADLLIAINVLPHVPALNDFVGGLKLLLKPEGVIAIQFSAYMIQLMQQTQFDMIYHEHFSYFSFYTIQKIFAKHGMTVFDVEEVPVHGGSLRIYIKHTENEDLPITGNVNDLLDKEKMFKIMEMSTYENFPEQVKKVKTGLWNFLISARNERKKVVCYGAPAKGNTLLNYCGIGKEFLEYTVDISPHKQGLYLPGTHIPIMSPEKIRETKPDYLLILAWNLKEEIIEQMSYIREWGGKFVVPIPEVTVYS
jgi:SAM-dependent methyltransferase